MPLTVHYEYDLPADLSEKFDASLCKNVEDMTDEERDARAKARHYGECLLSQFPGENPMVRLSVVAIMAGYYCGFLAGKGC